MNFRHNIFQRKIPSCWTVRVIELVTGLNFLVSFIRSRKMAPSKWSSTWHLNTLIWIFWPWTILTKFLSLIMRKVLRDIFKLACSKECFKVERLQLILFKTRQFLVPNWLYKFFTYLLVNLIDWFITKRGKRWVN